MTRESMISEEDKQRVNIICSKEAGKTAKELRQEISRITGEAAVKGAIRSSVFTKALLKAHFERTKRLLDYKIRIWIDTLSLKGEIITQSDVETIKSELGLIADASRGLIVEKYKGRDKPSGRNSLQPEIEDEISSLLAGGKRDLEIEVIKANEKIKETHKWSRTEKIALCAAIVSIISLIISILAIIISS